MGQTKDEYEQEVQEEVAYDSLGKMTTAEEMIRWLFKFTNGWIPANDVWDWIGDGNLGPKGLER